MWKLSVILLLGMVSLPGRSFAATIDLSVLDEEQNAAIVALQQRISRAALQFEAYMTEGYYLARWLHTTGYDVDAAFRALAETVVWRAREKINSILDEDWSELRTLFPFSLDTSDKDGRPIIYIDVGQWKTSLYLGGEKENVDRLLRYLITIPESCDAALKELRAGGSSVTQCTLLVNLAESNILDNSCIACVKLFRDASHNLGPHFPNYRDKVVAINTPAGFEAVYYALNEGTRSTFTRYGQDRSEWEGELKKYIEPQQIPRGLLQPANPAGSDNSAGKPEME